MFTKLLEGVDKALVTKLVILHTLVIAVSNYLVTIRFDSFPCAALPLSVSSPLAEIVDRLLLETLQQLFCIELDAARWCQAQWRVCAGGLGLRRRGGPHAPAGRRQSAGCASWPA